MNNKNEHNQPIESSHDSPLRHIHVIVPREIATKLLLVKEGSIGALIDTGDLEELTFREGPWVDHGGVRKLQDAWGVKP